MKAIHTSDWHLGQLFYGVDRTEEHLWFLARLVDVVKEERPDVLIVSGDIYDNVAPTLAAQRLYNRMLLELHAALPAMKIVVTAGNHDSSSRLDLHSELWDVFDVKVVGGIAKDGDSVDYDRHIVEIAGVGYIIAVPYVYAANYPQTDDDGVSRMRKFHQTLLDRVAARNCSKLPVIMMGHLALSGSDIKGHEAKSMRLVYENIEEMGVGYDYLALGHIHRPQFVTDNARYSGSPFAMSFDEDYPHSVSVVEIGEDGLSVREREIAPLVPVYTVPQEAGGVDEALEAIKNLPAGRAYLRVKLRVRDVVPMQERMAIQSAVAETQHLLCDIQPVREGRATEASGSFAVEEIRHISPLDVALDYYSMRFGGEMDDELKGMLEQCIEKAEKEDEQ